MIAWLKGHSEPITYATVGAGSPSHLIGNDARKGYRRAFSVRALSRRSPGNAGHDRRPYRDVRAGSIRQLSQRARRQSSSLCRRQRKRWAKSPDTPTFVELGIPDLVIEFWHGLWTTKGVPQDVVDRLNGAVRSALSDPAVRQRIEGLGQTIFASDQQTPQVLAVTRKPRSKNGGRSSRPPASRRANEGLLSGVVGCKASEKASAQRFVLAVDERLRPCHAD